MRLLIDHQRQSLTSSQVPPEAILGLHAELSSGQYVSPVQRGGNS